MKHSPAPLHRRIARSAQGTALSDRQIILRTGGRVRYIPFPRHAQAGALVVIGALAVWMAHTTASYFVYDDTLAAKEAELVARENAFAALRSELDLARRQFAEVTDSLEKNHKGLVDLIGQNQTLKAHVDHLNEEAEKGAKTHARMLSEKEALVARVAALEGKLKDSQDRNRTLAGELESAGNKLAAALEDRSLAHERGNSLSGRLSELQQRLASIKESQSSILERVSETSQAEIRRLRKVVASTGIALDKFLAEQGMATSGAGGPFEAAGETEVASASESFDVALLNAGSMLDQLENLQRIVRALPLAAPLDYYHVSSPYGVRKDPINGESAVHRGVDFGAKYRAPIMATAEGIVTYAGWKGGFGRFIEIDHGNGVVTRYGHLRRIMVKRGEKVDYRTQIGQIGNSGRSTGTHLHYEIHVNGKTVDPLKFLKAGKNVFKG